MAGSVKQFELDFEAGLLDRYPDFMDCVRAAVHGCGRALKAVAADLDMSASELSRRLADGGDIPFVLRRLPDLIQATNNRMPIYWLVERFCDTPENQHRRNVALLADLLPQIQKIVKAETRG